MAHDYIVNNPTKAAIASYKVYLDENDSDDPIYTLLKNAATQGTLNLNATGAIKSDYNQSNTNIDVKAQYGYDKKAGRYYLKVDGGKLLSTATIGNAASGNGDSTFIEMNLDPIRSVTSAARARIRNWRPTIRCIKSSTGSRIRK